MKNCLSLCAALLATSSLASFGANAEKTNYPNNRAPLVEKPYIALPLGAIKPEGWLLETLKRQKSGATGHMEELYPAVMGERNGWLGGDGDQWERGPYWIDGLLPLAYILNDDELKAKAQPWVESTLASQQENGFFGPSLDFPYEPGIQRDNAKDWWPRMVVLKILQQYYTATGDRRVLDFFTKYFRYQLETLPNQKLGNWTFWAEFRACDNLAIVYWLYNITGDKFLLDLGKLIHEQHFNFVDFINNGEMGRTNSIHCVNLAQGIKEPVIFYQQSGDRSLVDTVKRGFGELKKYNGQAQGMYGGDEALHGSDPTQGVELCAVVEMMYSLEHMTEITGDVFFADQLERIAFNALPAQTTDDFKFKQYYQQANQVMVSRHRRNFDQDHDGTDILFGTLTGYPCCFSNMHQGWPKFAQNLWYASADNGLAAMVYAPSSVEAKVANGKTVTIKEETNYPMDGKVLFTIGTKDGAVKFPLRLRIPSWCENASVMVNGKSVMTPKGGEVVKVERKWKNGDKVELTLPMKVRVVTWNGQNSISVERGPLVYALKMDENWERVKFRDENDAKNFGGEAWQVTSDSPWNYGIEDFDRNNPDGAFTVSVDESKLKSDYPWNQKNAAITIKTKAKRIPYWGLYNESAGPLPYGWAYWHGMENQATEEITLIPYGCTTLRISQFPIVPKH